MVHAAWYETTLHEGAGNAHPPGQLPNFSSR